MRHCINYFINLLYFTHSSNELWFITNKKPKRESIISNIYLYRLYNNQELCR